MHRSSSQARPLLAGISVVVALSVLVAGCGLIGGSTGRPVTVVGDSLSVLGTSEIRDVLRSAGWRPSVDAYPGVTVAASMDGLTKAAKKLDRPIVIELGTNDTHALAKGETDVGAEERQIDQALDLFARGQCVVWVNADQDPARPGGRGGSAVNNHLSAAAAVRPELRVADLNGLLRAHPEFLLADGVHLTAAGSTALGHLMADALASCPPA